MTPMDFIRDHERALASRSWVSVEPLIHDDAIVTFSDGSVHKGKASVKLAFERNFALINDEKYVIQNVAWVSETPSMAVFAYDFAWEGLVNGTLTRGSGVGTSVLVSDDGRWKLLVEHLGSRAVR